MAGSILPRPTDQLQRALSVLVRSHGAGVKLACGQRPVPYEVAQQPDAADEAGAGKGWPRASLLIWVLCKRAVYEDSGLTNTVWDTLARLMSQS